jgi:anti-sigma B factor antagonist
MNMSFCEDPIQSADVIARYLQKRLGTDTAEALESHYLECDECFDDIRTMELMLVALSQPDLERVQLGDVVKLDFVGPVQLIAGSREFAELSRAVLEQKDSRVLIDMGRVTRIDSAGLGLLMSCYSHVIRQRGSLKLLRPNASVQKVLDRTKLSTVLEVYPDELDALESFR